MTHPILYSFRRCPYAMRARMALLVAGIQVELREVVLRDRPEHMLEISPKGTVPVLLLEDGTVIEESMDIMQWALDESYFVGDWQSWSMETMVISSTIWIDTSTTIDTRTPFARRTSKPRCGISRGLQYSSGTIKFPLWS